jgi:sugar phosphate permease
MGLGLAVLALIFSRWPPGWRGGLFLAVMPSYAGKLVLHSQNLALLALVTALVLITSCAALLILGAILAGGGHGVAVLAAQDDLTRIAPDSQRAEVSAAFYVCVYLGVAVPVIGIGVLAVVTTLFTAATTFAAVTGGCALIVAAWHWRNRPGPPRELAVTPGRRGAASSRAAAR